MPLYNPTADPHEGPIGFYGVAPVARSTGYTAGYSTSAKALGTYTSGPVASPFTGGLLDLLQAARLADLNTTRVAVENLRVFAESMAHQHNQLVADLKLTGLIG